MPRRSRSLPIRRLRDGELDDARPDTVAIEEPLQIRLAVRGQTETVAVTMRTPGADFELAAGFLLSEGVIDGRSDIVGIAYCTDDDLAPDERANVVTVTLRGGHQPELDHFRRHFTITSACGVCGRTTIDDLVERGIAPPHGSAVPVSVITQLPENLAASQSLFAQTGGVHAAALFDNSGELLGLREDVGRHNAMDSLVGRGLLDEKLPFSDRIVMVSGRASFELVQKAAVAGIPIFCAVSAPSALAVATAERFGITLIAFHRGDTANVYTGHERIKTES
ncbi:MAG: formate dehydrogenase accessory sulfurtransferase FdhD [Acidimicrobiia bacterium]|nr:formate dehydrogenase accessory sulfurtransferase FdhD [Acidimicrobiia bacterium]